MNKLKLLKSLENFIEKINPLYAKYHRLADKVMPKTSNEFLKSIQRLKNSINENKLTDGLKKKKKIDDLIDWDILNSGLNKINQEILLPIFTESAKTRAKEFPKIVKKAKTITAETEDIKIIGSFNLRNEQAEEWAELNAGKLIVQIGDETKLAVNNLITTGLKDGRTYKQTARDIKKLIGLTDRQTQAVINHRIKLETMAEAGKSPFKTVSLTPEKIDKLTDKYYNKLLNYRAETISREETIRASKEGQDVTLNNAIEQKYISTEEFERVWRVTADDRLCPDCAGIDGITAELNQPFETPFGPKDIVHLHITCRCAEEIRRKQR